MTSLRECWSRTEAHLRRAHAVAGAPPLVDFDEVLAHNELELAADVLVDFGDERDDRPREFWEALTCAYDSMQLGDKAKRCRFRMYEAEHGFVEARLVLTATVDGGRTHPVVTDYRPDWNLGTCTESGEPEINGAPITVEDAPSIVPGGAGLVRLHPL